MIPFSDDCRSLLSSRYRPRPQRLCGCLISAELPCSCFESCSASAPAGRMKTQLWSSNRLTVCWERKTIIPCALKCLCSSNTKTAFSRLTVNTFRAFKSGLSWFSKLFHLFDVTAWIYDGSSLNNTGLSHSRPVHFHDCTGSKPVVPDATSLCSR